MQKEKNKITIDNLYQRKLESFEPDISPKIWNNIKEDLHGKEKRKFIIVFQRVAAIALILLSLGAVTMFLIPEKNLNETIGDNFTHNIISSAAEKNKQAFTTNSKNEEKNRENTNSASNVNLDIQSANKVEKTIDQVVEVSNSKHEIRNSIPENNKTNAQAILRTNYKSEIRFESNDVVVNKSTEKFSLNSTNRNKSNNNVNTENNKNSELSQTFLLPILHASVLNDNGNEKSGLLLAGMNTDKVLNPNRIIQDEILTDSDREKFKIIVGGKISPIYMSSMEQTNPSVGENYFYATPNEGVNPNTTKSANYSVSSAYVGGVNLGIEKGKRLQIQTGVYYCSYQQHSDNIPVTEVASAYPVSYHTNFSNVEPSFTEETNYKILEARKEKYPNPSRGSEEEIYAKKNALLYQVDMNLEESYSYLEIPLLIKYKMIDRKIGMSILSGVNTGFVVNNSATIDFENSEIWNGTSKEYNSVNYKAMLGMGLDYAITRNLFINMEPMLRYDLKESNDPVFNNQYSFAFYTGINYMF